MINLVSCNLIDDFIELFFDHKSWRIQLFVIVGYAANTFYTVINHRIARVVSHRLEKQNEILT